MPALCGIGVLITRPLAQSQALCLLLEAEGAETWYLPVIEIRGIDAPPVAGPFDLAVFTSANAVRHAAGLSGVIAGAAVAAIGTATARALEAAGHAVDVQPAGGVDSESLLAHPRLADVAGQRVLLVKGCGGRALLESALTSRGARVQVAEVYERVPTVPDTALLSTLERDAVAGEVHVVTVTSAQIGLGLLDLLTPPLRRALDDAVWIVPTARVAAALQARGLAATVRVARSANDQGILAAVLATRGPSTA